MMHTLKFVRSERSGSASDHAHIKKGVMLVIGVVAGAPASNKVKIKS